MSQRDLPLWARGVAAGLLVFASWWLLSTDALRSMLGNSVGILCLGVIAGSVLRGMHLPLAVWPFGPWRRSFSLIAVIAVAAMIAALILLSGLSQPEALEEIVDPGMTVLVVAGAVFWGFSFGFVKQRPFITWYLLAVSLALLPYLIDLMLSVGADSGRCVWTRQVESPEGLDACQAGMLPTLMFLVAVGATSGLVTEELAFRRLLIGQPEKAGLVSLLAAALIATGWYAVLRLMVVEYPVPLILGAVGALNAGGIYVLSRSLLVSALYSGTFMASYWALNLSTLEASGEAGSGVSTSVWLVALVIGIGLAAVVFRRNGLLGDFVRPEEPEERVDVAGD
ncbi:MAG: hypothetical protein JSW51_05495 [Gemmatimonadota bacterium]|nr:MAG: hypothetical protein JSW51_05495 [Gemmatimonadota bacterium]